VLREEIKRVMSVEPSERKLNYRHEAEIIRTKAHEARDAEVRAQLLLIASLYDKLDEHLLVARIARRSDGLASQDPTE
jgi:hypothetical protein